jgi:type IV pilus assembly protein PilW
MKAAKIRPARPARPARLHAGFTLVELLVAVAISLVLTLAITLMLVRYEGTRRTLTSNNDSSIGGAYVAYLLDRSVRSAGSGFTQSWRDSFGCQLLVARSGSTKLPRSAAFPAPFATVPQTVRLAPVVVHAGAGTGGSDVLAVQTGSSGLGESALRVLTASATASGLRVPTTVGMRGGDLALVFQGNTECLMQEVSSGFAGGATQQVTFGGTYATAQQGTTRLQDMGATTPAFVVPIGNTTGNLPQFQLIGIGANSTLVTHDMLQLDGTDSVTALADGVDDLRVLYGVDTNDDGRIDSWQSPASSPWDAASLLNGSATARTNLSRIIAVRIGFLVRNSSPERTAVSPSKLTLFADLGSTLQVSRTLTSAEQLLRWRTVELTVPLRNVLLMPRP